MLPPKNILVVGGNAAGPAAAAKAKRTSPGSNVILFEAGNFISTGTCELPYVLSDVIDDYGKILFYSPESFEKEKQVKVLVNHFVEKIDRARKTITARNTLSNQSIDFPYDRLILTTGSKAKTIPSLPAELKNVFALKNVNDLIRIKSYLKNNGAGRVLIIGAGYVGLESAESFKKLGCSVTIIEKEKLPMPYADEEIGALLLDLLKKNDVEFIGGVRDIKFGINDNKLESITYEGRTQEYDLVLVAIGFEPNNSLAVSAKLQTGRYGGIKVDQKLRTNDPDIFAAGDNIEIINKITSQPDYFPIATTAHTFAHIAGENAAGGNSYIKSTVKNIAVKIFDKNLVIVGLNSTEASNNRFNFGSVREVAPNLVKVMPESESVFGKIIFEKSSKKILGAVFLGKKEVTGYGDLIASFIHNNIKVTELANINYNYTPPLSPFINLLSLLGRKAGKD
ncbi:MAG: FAD-dependent oxidoreductase [Ignavibacteriales bacterium]|nr:FAD-dependent oxidoreductase [Ignavibacteriales bacterium]